ncbi:hypothetical protein [Piscinibacter sp. XHJ-5]|uniref:hypothetical protein n=1 Tax=Piscinibacter sp. XHJ-5 TaxID=3037797 RepID=UPI002452D241|nr:hypothetical protein [Piscinibacter sp. XHJ-5]
MQAVSRSTRLVLQALAAATVALSASAAMAVEAEQFVPPPSTLSREEVKAAMAQPVYAVHNEASVFLDLPAHGRDAAEVRAEARQAARDHHFNELYVGA